MFCADNSLDVSGASPRWRPKPCLASLKVSWQLVPDIIYINLPVIEIVNDWLPPHAYRWCWFHLIHYLPILMVFFRRWHVEQFFAQCLLVNSANKCCFYIYICLCLESHCNHYSPGKSDPRCPGLDTAAATGNREESSTGSKADFDSNCNLFG